MYCRSLKFSDWQEDANGIVAMNEARKQIVEAFDTLSDAKESKIDSLDVERKQCFCFVCRIICVFRKMS